MPPTRTAPLSNRPDETHVDRVHLQVTRDADRPNKIASREAVAVPAPVYAAPVVSGYYAAPVVSRPIYAYAPGYWGGYGHGWRGYGHRYGWR